VAATGMAMFLQGKRTGKKKEVDKWVDSRRDVSIRLCT
jgi:hypothetical protein